MTSLSDKQQYFTLLVSKLLTWACYQPGYGLTLGEAFRTTEQAALNAQSGKGIANSLHRIRLAIDLNLFIDGKYQTDTSAYERMGKYWKSLDPFCRWGGDFSKPDGNHFSLENDGVR